jgi:hypothetical protein
MFYFATFAVFYEITNVKLFDVQSCQPDICIFPIWIENENSTRIWPVEGLSLPPGLIQTGICSVTLYIKICVQTWDSLCTTTDNEKVERDVHYSQLTMVFCFVIEVGWSCYVRSEYLIWQSEHVVQREGCGNITLSGFNFPVFILFVRVSVSVSASSLVSNVIIFSFWTILGFYCFLRWHLSFSNCNNVAFCRDFVFGEWKCCSWRVAMLSRID